MKIALIHCPFGHRDFSENLKIVDEEFCVAPPLVLAYVASILEKAGHEVVLIDAHVLKLTKERTCELLKDFSPQLIGFRADSYWFHRVVEWAGFLKKSLSVPVVVGGVNVTLYPEESVSYPCFDYGIIGEANASLPELAVALERGSSLCAIAGLVYKENGRVMVNPAVKEPVRFDAYPFPARHLLPNHLYYSFTSQRKNFTIMVTSTGCPFDCTFCAIAGLPYRERSAENVVDEIEECYRRYGIREIDFFDATFFVNKKRFLDICDRMRARGIKVEWSCRSRVDVVDEEILKAAYRAGCRKIYYGIESSSPRILGKINKQIESSQIRRTIDLTYRCGIKALGFFMVGCPGETKESILASIAFAKTLNLDFIQVCRAIAKPNTGLHRYLTDMHHIDYWREYILGKRGEEPLPAPWSTLSEGETERYVKKFYDDFYFRPSYILKRISGIRSARELVRYGKVAARWLFCNRNGADK
jgi:anaerobic magnesium-protoporphyrin IX monomethyl ester cyclase